MENEFDWLHYEENEEAKHHYATHGLRNLKKLYEQQFDKESEEALFRPLISLKKAQDIIADSLVTLYLEYGTYDNDVFACELIEVISFVIEESLINKIQNSPYWSIQIDESNMIKQEKILAIVSKHLSDNYLITHFLGIIQLEDAAAQPIVNSINQFLLAKKLDLNNMFHMESNSASTMLAEYITISEVYMHLNATIDTITTQYIGHYKILPNYGNFLKENMDEQKILPNDLPDFISQFAIATIESFHNCFSNSEILNALRIFDSQELLSQYK
ncbi:20990_t:CDS:2 [Gigaspora margarita]|uniref:20990_t:CDS:1 n=1 Tax=Gigaspora margarita TaxID=4874 RepID=A0ABM8W066_GIGMA|nr:20990_t:CDS:2 [Gigaspora margarita]